VCRKKKREAAGSTKDVLFRAPGAGDARNEQLLARATAACCLLPDNFVLEGATAEALLSDPCLLCE